MNARGLLAAITVGLALLSSGAKADPQLSFSPDVVLNLFPSEGIADPQLEYHDLYYTNSPNFSSTGDGNAFSSAESSDSSSLSTAYANVGAGGTANASIFLERIFTIENVSGAPRTYGVDYGYDIAGFFSTARGTTHSDWTVGILDTDLPLTFQQMFESQSFDCKSPADDYYSCFNFFDSNSWEDYVTLDPGVVYTAHTIISMNLAAAAAPEAPSWLLLIAGLFGCIFLGRAPMRRASRALSTP